jgi:hypothetical protein
MRKAMREPLFVEFVDECLRIVEPQPAEITDEQVGNDYQYLLSQTILQESHLKWIQGRA